MLLLIRPARPLLWGSTYAVVSLWPDRPLLGGRVAPPAGVLLLLLHPQTPSSRLEQAVPAGIFATSPPYSPCCSGSGVSPARRRGGYVGATLPLNLDGAGLAARRCQTDDQVAVAGVMGSSRCSCCSVNCKSESRRRGVRPARHPAHRQSGRWVLARWTICWPLPGLTPLPGLSQAVVILNTATLAYWSLAKGLKRHGPEVMGMLALTNPHGGGLLRCADGGRNPGWPSVAQHQHHPCSLSSDEAAGPLLPPSADRTRKAAIGSVDNS